MRAIARETAYLFRAAGAEGRAADDCKARTGINPPAGSPPRLMRPIRAMAPAGATTGLHAARVRSATGS